MRSKPKNKLLSNFLSLSSLQAVNMILPLITFPYIVRVLGVETFGLVSFVLAIIMLFNILVGFGFGLSATKDISSNQQNLKKVSEIFVSVMTIKIVLLFFSMMLLILLMVIFDSFEENKLLYFVTFGLILGNAMFPVWFFQGMEDMKFITFVSVGVNVVFTALIFIFIQEESDYIYLALLNSLAAIIAGLVSLIIVFKIYVIELKVPTKKHLVFSVASSYHFFLSRVANDGAKHLAVVMIGSSFGNVVVGYYSIVVKLFYAFMSAGGVVSQTMYPYMCRTKNLILFKKIFLIVMIVSSCIFILSMLYHKELLELVFNIQSDMLSMLFLIVFSGSLFGIASALLGYPILAAFNYVKEANNTLIYAAFLYVIYLSITIYIGLSIYIVALSIALYSLLTFIFRLYFIKKYNIFNSGVK